MRSIILLLSLVAASAIGGTYYVRTDGNDSNDGLSDNAGGAWLTVHHAAATATAGDHVYIRSGTYNEYVTNLNSGTAGSPIVFEGERDVDGSWLTIIDPSTDFSTGWTNATDINSNVWAKAGSFQTAELSITNRRVAFVYSLGNINSHLTPIYDEALTSLTNGVQFLQMASNATVHLTSLSSYETPWWDGIEALWCSTGIVTYIRFRDGSEPNGYPIRVSPNGNSLSSSTVYRPTVLIDGQSYITYTNMLVRGGFAQFHLTGADTHHVTLSSNYVAAGCKQVAIESGAHNNTLFGNRIVTDYYGYTSNGGWEVTANAQNGIRGNTYAVSKELMGAGTSHGYGVLASLSNSNLLSMNTVTQSIGQGIQIAQGITAASLYNTVCSNYVSGHPSVGITPTLGSSYAYIYDNYIGDCNAGIRIHQINNAGETNRILYIYRNRFWLPTATAKHISYSIENTSGFVYCPTVYIYHNSFSGGYRDVDLSDRADAVFAATNSYIVNNIMSDPSSQTPVYGDPTLAGMTNGVAAVDYNLFYPAYNTSTLFLGTHNITNASSVWVSAEGMSFAIPSDSLAVDAAIDTSVPFTVQGHSLAALPDSATKVGAAWDMGALENERIYYVATNGNNSSDGLSRETAWSNVWYAANNVLPGDTVVITAGTYNEYVTNTVSGSNGAPITFTGERDGSGNWLTIIDPSTDCSTGWYTNSGLGYGIYTNASLSFATRTMTIDGKTVGYVYTNGNMATAIANGYQTNWATGFEVMSLPSDTVVIQNGNSRSVNFWDGIEALYCSTGTVAFLRLRDGSNPNGLNIRCAPNREDRHDETVQRPAWNFNGKNFVTVSNLWLRGAWAGFYLNASHDCIMASNLVQNGTAAAYLESGAYANTIYGNRILYDWYAGDGGAWENAPTSAYDKQANMYICVKYLMGNGSSRAYGVYLIGAGGTNTVTGNYIGPSGGNGMSLVGAATPMFATVVSSNTFEGHSSVGTFLDKHQQTRVFDNLFSDNNSQVRIPMTPSGGETNRALYIYRNRFYLPTSIASHVYTFSDSPPVAYHPTIWLYHNSFSGGVAGFQTGSGAGANLGFTNMYWLNNIFSSCWYVQGATLETNANYLAAWDYNLSAPPQRTTPAWYGSHNLTNATLVWNNESNMSFSLTNGTVAIDTALDTTVQFVTYNNSYYRTNAALLDTATKVGAAWDMGALEYSPPPFVNTNRVQYTEDLWIK